jgi:hypothetical protein
LGNTPPITVEDVQQGTRNPRLMYVWDITSHGASICTKPFKLHCWDFAVNFKSIPEFKRRLRFVRFWIQICWTFGTT